jgi:hypothetical protein
MSEMRNEMINNLLLQVLDLKVKAAEGKEKEFDECLLAIKNIAQRLEDLQRGVVSDVTRKIYN